MRHLEYVISHHHHCTGEEECQDGPCLIKSPGAGMEGSCRTPCLEESRRPSRSCAKSTLQGLWAWRHSCFQSSDLVRQLLTAGLLSQASGDLVSSHLNSALSTIEPCPMSLSKGSKRGLLE